MTNSVVSQWFKYLISVEKALSLNRRDTTAQRTPQRTMKGKWFLSYKNNFPEFGKYKNIMKVVKIHLDWVSKRNIRLPQCFSFKGTITICILKIKGTILSK